MIDQLLPALSGVGKTSPVQSDTSIRPSAAVSETGSDFSSMLARMAGDTVDTLKAAEQVSIAGMKDKASVQQVVEIGHGCRAVAANGDRRARQGGQRVFGSQPDGNLRS